MKHTSIRLSEDHAARIAETRESPTAIIKKALDAYFNMDPARELMDEHLRLYHRAQSEHVVSTKHKAHSKHMVSTDKPQSSTVPHDEAQNEHKEVPIIAHKSSTSRAHDEHTLSTGARPKLSENPAAMARIKEMWNSTPRATYGQMSKELGYSKGSIEFQVKRLIKLGELK